MAFGNNNRDGRGDNRREDPDGLRESIRSRIATRTNAAAAIPLRKNKMGLPLTAALAAGLVLGLFVGPRLFNDAGGWNPEDLGYLTIYAAVNLARDAFSGEELSAGRLGSVEVSGTEILLGEPLVFSKENVAEFDF